MPRMIPAHLHKFAPKREDFETQEDYEEAVAYFRHRFQHVAQPMKSPSKDSRSE